jgi:hypothetical protein
MNLALIFALALLVLAAFIASRPWMVHGGRFVPEYMLLAGLIGIVGLIVLWMSQR